MAPIGTLIAATREVVLLRRSTKAHRPCPPRQGFVVEVGGGQSPHPRTDLVVEKYVADDFERPGGLGMSFAKPLVVGDGHRLPLASASADYTIASHVLEHAHDPVEFAAELMRVAPAGFVQVPSRESELTYGWRFHSWLIDLIDGGLVFTARRVNEVAPVGRIQHELYSTTALARLAFEVQRSTWHHSVEWRGLLPVSVHGASIPEQTADFDLDATIKTLEAADIPPLPDQARRSLACPACRSSIDLGRTAKCSSCEAEYPVANGVPILLEEATVARIHGSEIPQAIAV